MRVKATSHRVVRVAARALRQTRRAAHFINVFPEPITMQSEVRVILDERTEWRFDLDTAEPMGNAEAREWLDAQFTQLGSEPLRPTGKLLLADKVLVVARDAGRRLLDDADWGATFARAASAALAKQVVRIDLAAMTVSY